MEVVNDTETEVRIWRIRAEVEKAKQTLKEKYEQEQTDSKEEIMLKMKKLEYLHVH